MVTDHDFAYEGDPDIPPSQTCAEFARSHRAARESQRLLWPAPIRWVAHHAGLGDVRPGARPARITLDGNGEGL